MSIILLIISVLTAAANDRGWAFPIRLALGPLFLNIFMLALLLGVVVAFLPDKMREMTSRHRLLAPTLILFGLGLAVGIFGTITLDSSLLMNKVVGTAIRDYLVMPISVLVGYRLAANPRTIARFPYIMVAAGLAVSVAVFVSFQDAAEDVTASSNVNVVRTVAFLVDYAGLACALLLFSIMANVTMFPRWVSLALGSICLLGQVAPLSRSSWLACLVGIMTAYALVPVGRRKRAILNSLIIVPALVGTIWFGIYLASAATGWDFYARMQDRVMTLLPGADDGRGQKAAWDTRTPGALMELSIWSENPIMGKGFGVQEYRGYDYILGIHHNAWTDILAKAGLIGLAPYVLVIGSSILIGFRMVRQRVDRTSMLIGALGAITGTYYILLGMATWSFNDQRTAICIGVIFGVLLRSREYQLAQVEEVEHSMESHPSLQPVLSGGF